MNSHYPVLRRICWFVGSLVVGVAGFGQVPQVAPLNPEFVKYQQAAVKVAEPNYGLIPSPVDLSHLSGQQIPQELRPRVALAPVYDLRPLGKVTSVKNQGAYGTCWAHATFGSMESCLLPYENRNFSENNLVNRDGFDYSFNSGGHYFMSMAYLAGWSGPVNEADDPYPNPDNSPAGLPAEKHARQMRVIPGKSSPTGNDIIKQAVLDHGAVYATYYHDFYYWNTTYNAYRYTGSAWGNHAVTLVGWDDGFDRNKFTSVPPGDGAYIVKNSWGTSWGESGYYYVSYYDSRFGYEPMCVFHDTETPDDFSGVYAYDPLGWVSSLGLGTTTFWGANIFTATTTGELGAVGFYANSLNTGYTIRVYTGVLAGKPGSGTLVATKTGTSPYAGYCTVSLNAPAALTEGQRFSIVLGLTTPGYNYPIPFEFAVSGYSSAATSAAGQSYYSGDGSTWVDLWSWNNTANFCIKGYTIMNGSPEIAVEQPAENDLGDGVGAVAFGATAIEGFASTRLFTIRNIGPRYLKGVSISADGGDREDYVVDTAELSSILAPGGSTTFNVTFKPLGTVSGTRSAALHIASNDEDENPFDISLTGQAFSTIADWDGDGLNDWAEYLFAPLGFDWARGQPELVVSLFENANSAGLFTASQVQALHLDTPLLARDPEGHFTLSIGLWKSTDLMQWSEFPFTNPGTTLNGEGKVEFDFTTSDNAAFFRLETR